MREISTGEGGSPLPRLSLSLSRARARGGGAPTMTPCFEKACLASAYMWLELRSALEGMQPTFRHVPPSVPRPSTHVTFMPSCAALMDAT